MIMSQQPVNLSSAIYLGIFSRAEQRVLQAIFKAIAEGGDRCVSTLTMLAHDSNTSKSTARNAIAHAVQIGLLEKTERRSDFSVSLPNILTYGAITVGVGSELPNKMRTLSAVDRLPSLPLI
jgi:hypothetical protein